MQSAVPSFVFHEIMFLIHHYNPQTKSKSKPIKDRCSLHNHGDEEDNEHEMFRIDYHTRLQFANRSDATGYLLSVSSEVKLNSDPITRLLPQAK